MTRSMSVLSHYAYRAATLCAWLLILFAILYFGTHIVVAVAS